MHLHILTLSVPVLAVLACTGALAQPATPPPALLAPSPPPLSTPATAPAPALTAPVAAPSPPIATPLAAPLAAPPVAKPASAAARPASGPVLLQLKPPPTGTARAAAPAPRPANDTASTPELKPGTGARVRTDAPRLNPAARASMVEAENFANNPSAMPVMGKGGKLIFTFGDAIPTVVCAPLRVCDVELEPGENILGAPHIGDAVRWRIAPAVSYDGDQRVIHLVIKATAADLDTNLIVPTDRRTYYLRLVSSEDKYVSRVAFEYPEDTRAWLKVSVAAPAARAAASAPVAVAAGTATPTVPADELPSVSVGKLRFDYQVTIAKGTPKFKPVRVMDDGARLYITMADNMPVDEAPVLFLIGPDGSEQLVNYRLRGNIFIIDRLADKIALVSGSGSAQQRVDISRGVCDRTGWFHSCPSASTAARGE